MKIATLRILGGFLLFASACTPRGSRPSELCSEPTTAPVLVSSAPLETGGVSASHPIPLFAAPITTESFAPCPAALSPRETTRALSELGSRTLAAIETGDFEGLARVAHPTKGLALGTFGSISHTITPAEVRAASHDKTPRFWDGSSNMGDGPIELTYGAFLRHLRSMSYSKADMVGYSEVVQEDSLCGDDCVAKDIAAAFSCAPFIQYDHSTGSKHNPGMWHFVVVAFERDAAGWHVIGLLENAWSP